jgi:hypothetical protein
MKIDSENKYKTILLTDTIVIYNYLNYVLYQLPAKVVFETENKIKGTESFFIFKKDSKYGIFINSIKDSKKGEKLLVDSFLAKRALKDNRFSSIPDTTYKLANTTLNNGIYIEVFLPIQKKNENIFDSIIFYYSKKYNSFEYSFSPKLDSLKQRKLFKIRLLFKEKFSPAYNAVIPQREYLYEIEPTSAIFKKAIIKVIEKYKASL